MPSRFEALQYESGERPERKVIGPREIYGLFRRRFLIIAAVVLVGTLLAVLAAVESPKTYTAQSMVVLRSGDPNLLDSGTEAATAQQPVKPTMDTESDLILSRGFLGYVVDELNLVNKPKFNRYLSSAPSPEETAPKGWFGRGVASIFDAVGWGEAAPQPLPDIQVQRDNAISILLSKISIARNGDSLAMTVSLRDDDAVTAAALVNAITQLFVEWSRDQKREDIKSAANFLRQQSNELAANIAKSEQEIADYSRQNGVSSDPRDDLLRLAMQQANEQLSAARGDLNQAQARLAQVQKEAAGTSTDGDPLLTSGFLTTLRNDEAAALRDRAQLARNFGANHPLLLEADAKVASVRLLLSQEQRRIIANLENDVRVAQGRVDKVSSDLSASEQELRGRSVAEIKLRELNRDLQTEQKLYDVVSSRLGKLDPYSIVADPGARVVSLAEVPTEPAFPKPRVLVVGGLTASLVIAFLMAMALDGFDTRIRSAERSSLIFRAPLLASIPRLKSALYKRTFDTPALLKGLPYSRLGESFRAIHNACRRSQVGKPDRVIAIGSALPSEGRTTTAIGLARIAAADGARTVLLDLDRCSGTLSKSFGCSDDVHSLEDYLDGRCNLNELEHAIPDIPNLSVITAQARRDDHTAALRPQQIDAFVGALRDEYDVIVIDVPPLLVVEDAIQIASCVDAVVLVVAYGRTTEDSLIHARERLRLNKVPLTGIVMTQVDPKAQHENMLLAARASRRSLKRYFV